MNRFEIITEKIGVLGKDIPEDVAQAELSDRVTYLLRQLNGASFDDPDEVELIKMDITDVMYALLVIAGKRGHCGACLCSDLEGKLRHNAGHPELKYTETIKESYNGNKEVHFLRDDEDLVMGSPNKNIFERGAGDLVRYQIRCDVISGNLVRSVSDRDPVVSSFKLPINPVVTEIKDNPFFRPLCEDLHAYSGFTWYCYMKDGYIKVQTDNFCPDVSLVTRLTLIGDDITAI